MKHLIRIFLPLFVLTIPLVASADTLFDVLGFFGWVLGSLAGSLMLLAFVVFFYGLAKFILASGDPKAAQEGKGVMIWGVVALFVLISIMGIIGFLERSLGTDSNPGAIPIEVPVL
jgi:hypothetical protein